jgi:hypothetical protein
MRLEAATLPIKTKIIIQIGRTKPDLFIAPGKSVVLSRLEKTSAFN